MPLRLLCGQAENFFLPGYPWHATEPGKGRLVAGGGAVLRLGLGLTVNQLRKHGRFDSFCRHVRKERDKQRAR